MSGAETALQLVREIRGVAASHRDAALHPGIPRARQDSTQARLAPVQTRRHGRVHALRKPIDALSQG